MLFTEWWVIAGILTENDGVNNNATTAVYNGYLQPSEGYRPNVFGSSDKTIKIVNNANSDYMQSDRRFDTFTFAMAESLGITPGSNTVFIPTLESDWGLLFVTGIDDFIPSAPDSYRIEIFGTSSSSVFINFTQSPLKLLSLDLVSKLVFLYEIIIVPTAAAVYPRQTNIIVSAIILPVFFSIEKNILLTHSRASIISRNNIVVPTRRDRVGNAGVS